jgi:hypothetical protein
MTDEPNTKPEPQTFADLANQPSGSGVAAEQVAFMEAALEDATAEPTIGAGLMESSAAHARGITPTEGGPGEAESEAQPS